MTHGFEYETPDTSRQTPVLKRTTISYKGRVRASFEHLVTGDLVPGDPAIASAIKTEAGVTEYYDAAGKILFHTTPDGYKYQHTFEKAKKAITTMTTETITVPDPDNPAGKTYTFEVPDVTLVDDPQGEEIHRVTLVNLNQNQELANYLEGELKQLKLQDGTVLIFDRSEIEEIFHEDTGETETELHLRDATVFHKDGTITEFRGGMPYSVTSATGREISIEMENGELINASESAQFHYSEAQKLWNNLVKAKFSEYQPPAILSIVMEYTADTGKIVSREFAEGTIEVYGSDGKIDEVLSSSGELLIEYSYDSEGNPTQINLGGARRRLESTTLKLRAELALDRWQAISKLAEREQVLDQTIEGQYIVARDRLLTIRDQMEQQRSLVASIQVKGKQGKAMIADAMSHIQVGFNQLNAALEELAAKRSEALAKLDEQVREVQNDIEEQTSSADTEIMVEAKKARDQILKQEIMPIVFHWYRKILGRDPSQTEYDFVVNQANYDNPTPDDLNRLKDYLYSSTELSQRTVEVNSIKNRVESELNQYLVLTDAQKRNFAASLGVLPEELVLLASSEAQAILAWLRSRSLHFGQSAYLALEALLNNAGIAHNRVDLASRLILIDILTGTLTPIEKEDLVLSVYALNRLAKTYGLQTVAYKMTYEALKAMYDAACANQTTCDFRFIAHVDGNHYVIVTKVSDGEVTFIDPGKGPENALESFTLTKEQFESIWIPSGTTCRADTTICNTQFGFVISARAPPETLPAQSWARMSVREEMAVRGAFFFLLLPFLLTLGLVALGAFTLVGLIAGFDNLINAIKGILHGIGDYFAGLFTGDFKRMFKGLKEQFLSSIELFVQLLSLPIIGIQMTLEAFGVPPEFTQTVIAAGEIAVGVGLLFVPGAQAIGISLIAGGTGELINLHTNLSPELKQIISIGATAVGVFAGGFISSGNFNGALSALKSAAPNLLKDFASVGVMAVGNKLGIDPRVSGIIDSGVRLGISKAFGSPTGSDTIIISNCPESDPLCDLQDPNRDGKREDPWAETLKYLFDYLQDSIFGGDSNPDPDPGGNEPPPAQNNSDETIKSFEREVAINGASVIDDSQIEKYIENKYQSQGILDEIRQTALRIQRPPVADLASDSSFGQYLQNKGLAKGLNESAQTLFGQETLEKMVGQGTTVEEFINEQFFENQILDITGEINGQMKNLKRIVFDGKGVFGEYYLEYDPQTLELVNLREGNLGTSYSDLRYNVAAKQPYLVKGDITRLNQAGNVRSIASINGTNMEILRIQKDANTLLAQYFPLNEQIGIRFNSQGFLDYEIYEPGAAYTHVQNGLVRALQYRAGEVMASDGKELGIDILFDRMNEARENRLMKVIAQNISQFTNVDKSSIDTILRVISDHLSESVNQTGTIWVDDTTGAPRLQALADIFDFNLDQITKEDIIKKLNIPADRILSAENDLLSFAEQLIANDVKFTDAEQMVSKIRGDLINQYLPAILETANLEFTGFSPDNSKLFETKVSTGVIFRGEGSHVPEGSTKPWQAEIFVDKDGTVYYSDTALDSKGTYYADKTYLNSDGQPVTGKDLYQNGQVFEMQTTKRIVLEDGLVIEIPEKIRIEVANVFGSAEMVVITRKETGNFYAEAITKIKPLDFTTSDPELEEVTRGADLLEALVKAMVNFGGSILDINNLLKRYLV